jgi:hypothetical protein
MDPRHKTKAIIGCAVWFTAIPLGLLAGTIDRWLIQKSDSISGLIFLLFLALQYLSFFWGGIHLAKAKGYSRGFLIFGLFWPAQLIILPVLLFGLPDKCAIPTKRAKPTHPRNESLIARVVRYRRNAFVANIFGVAGVLVALAFVLLPLGLFNTRDNARVGGLLVFVPSYAAIIYGCYWWVRAKHWHEAVVFIGLCPLAPLVIPYVRILYLAAGVFPLLMVIMPILLIGVVAVLPDKSGIPKRKRWDRD